MLRLLSMLVGGAIGLAAVVSLATNNIHTAADVTGHAMSTVGVGVGAAAGSIPEMVRGFQLGNMAAKDAKNDYDGQPNKQQPHRNHRNGTNG